MTYNYVMHTTSTLYDVARAAEVLHLSKRAVQHRIKAGTIKATKIGTGRTSAYVITAEEIERVRREQDAA